MGQLKVTCVLLDLVLFCVMFTQCGGRDVDSSYVTCGSLVKLMNTRHSVRLHSHDVKYGSGITSVDDEYHPDLVKLVVK